MAVKVLNLTPHRVTCVDDELKELAVFEPSGTVARVTVSGECVGSVLGVPIMRQEYGEVTGLPEQEDGAYLLVSSLVRAASGRADLLSPAELVRSPHTGRVIACRAFATG